LMFQSSPDPKAGRYQCAGSRPVRCCSSNPHPTRRPGATGIRGEGQCNKVCSNPHPTRRPGATGWDCNYLRRGGCSNPHPTRRPGATQHFTRAVGSWLFQSSPDPKAGRYPSQPSSADSLGVFQSSPDPKAGRYLETRRLGRLRKSSNPHPTRRPGATHLG